VAALGGTWLLYKTLIERSWPKSILWAPFLTFSVIAAISLLNGSREITTKETIISGLYLVRFIEYFLLTFIALDLAKTPKYHRIILNALIVSATLLALAGFIQLKIKPDFGSFEILGWDPHQGRLLSTWFDPNFIGGLFAFSLSIITALILDKKITKRHKKWFIISGALMLYALLITYSRSAYLAFLGGMGIIGLMRSRQLLIGIIIASILLVSISARAQERVINLYYTAQSLVGIGAELPDATARLRLDSWDGAWTIIEDKPILGIGFNTYAYAQNRYGFLDDLKKHSATGSDSTLLTIWATTGILGFLAYLWLLGTILWVSRSNSLAIGFFAGIIALLIHSIFVNSLLFTPLLIFVYITLGLILKPRRTSSS
jgi:O-antigen ligase